MKRDSDLDYKVKKQVKSLNRARTNEDQQRKLKRFIKDLLRDQKLDMKEI